MDGDIIRRYRERHHLTQAEMAEAMGLPLRTYQDCEAAVSGFREVHLRAYRYAQLCLAIERQDPSLALPAVTDLASALVKLRSTLDV